MLQHLRIVSLAALGCIGCLVPTERDREAKPESVVVRSQIPEVPAPIPENHLALAAQCLERNDDPGALPHLRAHVAENPDAVMVRAYLAELQLRLGLLAESRGQYQRFLHDASAKTGEIRNHLVHAHTRIMEIASSQSDHHAEYLHRGIGLILLVQQWEREATPAGESEVESTLVKASEALRSAVEEVPSDPRAWLYLGIAYGRLGQASSAGLAMQHAKRNAAGYPWNSAEHALLDAAPDFDGK